MGLLKWLGAIAGVAGAPVTGGASLALTVAALAAPVASSFIQAHAQGQAAKLQKQSTDQALAYEKERDVYARGTEANRYGEMMRQTAPYRETGTAANTRMGDLLGLPPQAAFGAQSSMPGQQPGGQMVSLRAPDGTMKQVDQAHVQHYLSKGAV